MCHIWPEIRRANAHMTSLSEFQQEFHITLSPAWQEFFTQELQKPYFSALLHQVLQEYEEYTVYPPKDQLWRAFELTPFENLSGVLLGQDPYHGENQACGLSFSVPKGQKIPPSLKNVYKELQRTHNHIHSACGDLSWAQQGVLLLNTILTVRQGQPLSHKNLGWQNFSDAAICFITEKHPGAFFFLWGSHAQKKEPLITSDQHMIIRANHPSPLSRAGFVGCGCFVQADEFLKNAGHKKIFW